MNKKMLIVFGLIAIMVIGLVTAAIVPKEMGEVEITDKDEYIVSYENTTINFTEQQIADKLYAELAAQVEAEKLAVKVAKYEKLNVYLLYARNLDSLNNTQLDSMVSVFENSFEPEVMTYLNSRI
jgi:hypothetical protein